MSKRLNRFLIVDRAEDSSHQFTRLGLRLGYITETVQSLEDFTEALAVFSPTVVLIDIQSAGNDGLDHLKVMANENCDAQIVLASETNIRALETAKQLGEFLGLAVIASQRSPTMTNVVRHELRKARQSHTGMTLSDLASALESGQILPYYQPKACFRQRHGWPIHEVEALPAWRISEANTLTADDFLPLAEDGGLMPALTNSLIDQVIIQLREWRKMRINLAAAINIPLPCVRDTHFPDSLYDRVRAAHLEPADFTLEISEPLAACHSASAIDVLGRLKAFGFRLAIDEFGTGYCSVEQLYRLNFDELKIDPSLVIESRTSGEVRMIVEATVILGQKLGLIVCADGVDSQRSLQYIGRIGCNKAQGNYISRPLDARRIEARLHEWNVPAAIA